MAMKKTLAAGIVASMLAVTPAFALTVTNESAEEVTVGLDMGNKESVHKIPAGQSASFKSECDDGCGVTGPWGYSWMAKTGDTIKTDGKPLVVVTE
jgi:hypothetical protein